MDLNLTWLNTSVAIGFFITLTSVQIESPQVKFVRKLYAHHLITNDSIQNISVVIRDICSRTKFKQNININSGYDAQKLNFFIIDSRRDTSLKDLCAYAGAQTIFLDKYFLDTYLDRLHILKNKTASEKQNFYNNFQYWVIGHEIAHAELGHSIGHFINNDKPKTQEIARHYHYLELQADQRSLTYLPAKIRPALAVELTQIFNVNYVKLYGTAKTTNHYLRCDPAEYITYPYELDGSHPVMTIRTSVMLYLLKTNPTLTKEAYSFLLQAQLHYINNLNGKE